MWCFALSVARCVLFVDRRCLRLSIVCRMPYVVCSSGICYVLFVVRCSLLVACCVLCVGRCWSFFACSPFVCWLLVAVFVCVVAVWCLLFAVCCVWFVAWRSLFVVRRVSFVVCLLSRVGCRVLVVVLSWWPFVVVVVFLVWCC